MGGDSSPDSAPPHPPAPPPLILPHNATMAWMTTRPQSQPIPIPTMRSNPIPPTPTDATNTHQPPPMHNLRARSSESFRQRDTSRASAFSMSPDPTFNRVRINNSAPLAALPPKSSPTPSRPFGGAASITDAKSVRSMAAASTISPEDEVLSLKVRSLYDSGVGLGGSDAESQFSKRVSSVLEEGGGRGSRVMRNSYAGRNSQSGDEAEGRISLAADKIESPLLDKMEEPHGGPAREEAKQNIDSPNGLGIASMERSEFLLAGGTEDWEDLNGADVDRFV
ncbi:hypothetical protein L873DRAFT_1028341 [Choiromyces venosus 120613-1]|uniref:Uncharacterized protein n=1 Tax=Choiromyces venosus 120613-1 TaxID=1336337 RepID=A0A3N4JNV8_9PEZI|nr:hypothetical protein L873DRAFT_1028341 [Choiromyces venosus 120613-1]